MFMSIKNIWIYVPKTAKTFPILASVAFSFSAFSPLVYRSHLRLQMYDTPYPVILFTPKVTISPNFLGYFPKELPRLPQSLVDSLFNEFIQSNFPNSLLIFTDGSVSVNSAGFSFFIPALNLSTASKLDAHASSFTTECHAIISALRRKIMPLCHIF